MALSHKEIKNIRNASLVVMVISIIVQIIQICANLHQSVKMMESASHSMVRFAQIQMISIIVHLVPFVLSIVMLLRINTECSKLLARPKAEDTDATNFLKSIRNYLLVVAFTFIFNLIWGWLSAIIRMVIL